MKRRARGLLAALLAVGLVPAARGEEALPPRLELPSAPADLPTPEALLLEARQSLAALPATADGSIAGRVLPDTEAAIVLQRALAGIDGRAWQAASLTALETTATAAPLLSDGRTARARLLGLITSLAVAAPEQAEQLLARLPEESEFPLRASVAFQAGLGMAARDPERAERLTRAVTDGLMRGQLQERIGREWLRRGDWARAVAEAQTAGGAGQASLLAELARQATPPHLEALVTVATTPALKAVLAEGIALRHPAAAALLVQELRGTAYALPAAAWTAAGLARTDPARSLAALDAGLAATDGASVAALPAIEELTLSFARAAPEQTLAVARRLHAAGANADGAPGRSSAGDGVLARIAAGVAALDVPRAAALLALVVDPAQRRWGWQEAGANAVVRGVPAAEELIQLAGDGDARGAALAGAARELAEKDGAAAFALALRVPDPLTRGELLSGVLAAAPGVPVEDQAGALFDTGRELMADYRRMGAAAAFGACVRRLAALNRERVVQLVGSSPDATRWRDIVANQVGPVDPALAETLSPEVGHYWALQARLAQLQAVATRDPREAVREVQAAEGAPTGRLGELFRSRALASAGIALAGRDAAGALAVAEQIPDPEERAQYLMSLSERLPLREFSRLIGLARALPPLEWRARALAALALQTDSQQQAVARTAAAHAADPTLALGECRAALFFAPLLAETHYNLGQLLDRAGRSLEARACYARYLELRPGSSLAAALRAKR